MDEWVSINDEKKPEDGEECLVYIKGNYVSYYKLATYSKNLYYESEYDFYDKHRPGFFGYDSEWGFYEVTGFTHWMSLPDAPKEG
jgi:hypothetical protein